MTAETLSTLSSASSPTTVTASSYGSLTSPISSSANVSPQNSNSDLVNNNVNSNKNAFVKDGGDQIFVGHNMLLPLAPTTRKTNVAAAVSTDRSSQHRLSPSINVAVGATGAVDHQYEKAATNCMEQQQQQQRRVRLLETCNVLNDDDDDAATMVDDRSSSFALPVTSRSSSAVDAESDAKSISPQSEVSLPIASLPLSSSPSTQLHPPPDERESSLTPHYRSKRSASSIIPPSSLPASMATATTTAASPVTETEALNCHVGVKTTTDAKQQSAEQTQTQSQQPPPLQPQQHKFFIERAVTNKARCRACHNSIDFNEWRFGVSISKRLNNPEPFKSWHHISCLHLSFAQPHKFAKFVTNPDVDIRDWMYIDAAVRQSFIDELIKLKEIVKVNLRKLQIKAAAAGASKKGTFSKFAHKHSAKSATRRSSSNDSAIPRKFRKLNNGENDDKGFRNEDDEKGSDDENVDGDDDFNIAAEEAMDIDADGTDATNKWNIVLPESLFACCLDRFADIAHPDDDSLQAYNAIRQCLADVNDVKERVNVLRLWFSHGRDGQGFRGDVRLWFCLMINDCMNRSFGIKNKQLTKFFSTKILHIPLGVIEANVRNVFLNTQKGLAASAMTANLNSERSVDGTTLATGSDGPSIWLSRSSERRMSNKHLPSLLVDMLRNAENSKFVPRTTSTLTLQQTWSYMEKIASFNKEAARNQVLQSLLDECSIDDVEPMLRILFSESGTRFSLRQILNAFMPGVYNEWFREAKSPKANIYNQHNFDILVELMDFSIVTSYKFEHLLKIHRVSLRPPARPTERAFDELCMSARKRSVCDDDDDDESNDGASQRRKRCASTQAEESGERNNNIPPATTSPSLAHDHQTNRLGAALMLVKCAKLMERCSFAPLENYPID